MARGPMAKHPDARQRRNAAATTAKEIILAPVGSRLQPVPELPPRMVEREVKDEEGNKSKELVEVDWHNRSTVAWAEMWQFPLVYSAPEVDRHMLYVYIALIDDFWRKLEAGRAITEQANQIRAFSEQWGIGEKARRHLQITIGEAEEAIERGRQRERKRLEEEQAPIQVPSAAGYTPSWSDEDEDSELVEAEVIS